MPGAFLFSGPGGEMKKKVVIFQTTHEQDIRLRTAQLETGKTKSALVREAIDKVYGRQGIPNGKAQNQKP